jgi:hypothetical protein
MPAYEGDSLVLDHDMLRRSLSTTSNGMPSHFGPPTPRKLDSSNFVGKKQVPKKRVDNTRRQLTGVSREGAASRVRPSTADALGFTVGSMSLETSLDFSMLKSTLAKPLAATNVSGHRGTGLGHSDLKTDVVLRTAVRSTVQARRDLSWAQARPLLVDFIRLHEPPSAEELEAFREDNDEENVGTLVRENAATLPHRVGKLTWWCGCCCFYALFWRRLRCCAGLC